MRLREFQFFSNKDLQETCLKTMNILKMSELEVFVAKKYKSSRGMHTSGDICRENATIVQEVTTRKLPAWRQLDNSVKRSKV